MFAAVVVPYNLGGHTHARTSILERHYLATSIGFALEPISTAIASLALSLFWRDRRYSGAFLTALGAQTFVLFLGYLTTSLAANGDYSSVGPGAFVGMLGASLVTTAGILLLRSREAQAASDTESP